MKMVIALAAAMMAAVPVPAAMAAPSSYRAYVDGRWGQIHVRVAGPASGPTVILVHKMVWSSIEFARAQPFLAARGIRSIAVDLPGYGLSDGPENEPTADDYADALIPVLDRFKIRQATMLGVNTGATIVTAFALRHPDRTRAVILDGPPVFKGEALAKALAEPEFDRRGQPDGGEFVARWREINAMAKGSLDPETIHVGLLQFFQAGPHYLYGHQAIFKYPLDEAIRGVKAPVALLTYPGDQLRAQALALKQAHPSFSVIETAWPRMMADFQDPEPWANAVAEYMKRK